MNTIRKIRTAQGLTRAEFAELLNIPNRTVRSWENGEREPPEYLVNLIQFFLNHR